MPSPHIDIAHRVVTTNVEKAELYKAVNNTLNTGKSFTVGRQGSVYTVKRVGSDLQVTQTEQSRLGTIRNWLASRFGDRLTGSQRLANELRLVSSTQVYVNKRVSDPVAAAVIQEAESPAVAQDIRIAMSKIQDFVELWVKESDGALEGAQGAASGKKNDVLTALSRPGRDAKHYATVNPQAPMIEHLRSWNASDPRWTPQRTCGLLLDLGLALKSQTIEAKEGRMGFFNGVMEDSRGERRIMGKTRTDINLNSRWATEFTPEGSRMNAGVSATTGSLLTVLRHINQTLNSGSSGVDRITGEEIEAVMIGATKFWDDKSKSTVEKFKGAFHTPAEVWSAYTFHLTDKLRYDQGRLGGLQDTILGELPRVENLDAEFVAIETQDVEVSLDVEGQVANVWRGASELLGKMSEEDISHFSELEQSYVSAVEAMKAAENALAELTNGPNVDVPAPAREAAKNAMAEKKANFDKVFKDIKNNPLKLELEDVREVFKVIRAFKKGNNGPDAQVAGPELKARIEGYIAQERQTLREELTLKKRAGEADSIRNEALKLNTYNNGDEIKDFDMSVSGGPDEQARARAKARNILGCLSDLGGSSGAGSPKFRLLERGGDLEFRLNQPAEEVSARLRKFERAHMATLKNLAIHLDAQNAVLTVPKNRLDDAGMVFNRENVRDFIKTLKREI